MALWSNTDAAGSAPKYTVDVTTGNTGTQAYNIEPIGVWAVDSTEARAQNVNGHAGWILRTVGSGGRAGRTQEETLVAMGSISTDAEDTVYPDAIITIVTQPSAASVIANTQGANSVTFTVVASATPSDATLSYLWQQNDTVGGGWIAVVTGTPANTTYSGNTTATLTVTPTNKDANNYVYRVTVSSAGATSVVSSNASIDIR